MLGELLVAGQREVVLASLQQTERSRVQVRRFVHVAHGLSGAPRETALQAAVACARSIEADGTIADAALEVAVAIEPPEQRAHLIRVAARTVQAALVEQAVADVGAMTDAHVRTEVLGILAAQTPAKLLAPVYRATELIREQQERDVVRCDIAETAARGGEHVMASIVVAQIKTGELRAKTIEEIALSTTIPVGSWSAYYLAAQRIRTVAYREQALTALDRQKPPQR
ncbi:MAG: hypothetical protein M3R24_07760 [Chloroflexota bacterium]|nr:hypothetical protein [Chloroflexota bacterium]